MPDDPGAAKPRARHVVLVGAMGSGKTTIGVSLAAALSRPFVDNDAQLFVRTGASAADLAARDGIDALHAAESDAVLAALDVPDASVIAAAASTITDPAVRRVLAQRSFVVWLRADHAVLAARLPRSSTRPFAAEDPARLVTKQARERDPLFQEVADLAVRSDASSRDAVVAEILERLPEAVKLSR